MIRELGQLFFGAARFLVYVVRTSPLSVTVFPEDTMRTVFVQSRKFLLTLALGISAIALPTSTNAATYGEQVVAAIIMGEARGEGIEGMIAVGEVIWERAKIKRTVPRKIATEPKQFSCLNGTSIDSLIKKYSKHKEWAQAITVAEAVYNHPWKLPGLTKGATHYNVNVPYWARGKRPSAVIGNHIFWRMPDEVH